MEIARSFSLKVNLGNYEMADFFASQKAECELKDAEKISEALYQFCRAEVIKSVNIFTGKTAYEARIEKLDNTFPARIKELKKHPPEDQELLSDEMMRKNIPPFKTVQGRSPAEKADQKSEVRAGVMLDQVQEI